MDSEKDLYERIWSMPEYSKRCQGVSVLNDFLKYFSIRKEDLIADIGCGSGRVAQALDIQGYIAHAYDIAENCLDSDIDVPFRQIDIGTEDLPMDYDWIFCADVMEHLPTEEVRPALEMMRDRTKEGLFFSIALFTNDKTCSWGHENLHKTVEDVPWWTQMFAEVFEAGKYHVTIVPDENGSRVQVRIRKRYIDT